MNSQVVYYKAGIVTGKRFFLPFFLFLINPVLGFLHAIRHIRAKGTFPIIFLFSLVYGLAFSVPKDRFETNLNVDASFYREYFEYCNVRLDFIDWWHGFIAFISLKGESRDYYLQTIAFFSSIFSDNYHFFFLIVACVLAVLYLKCLPYIVQNHHFRICPTSLCLLYLFSFTYILGINALRFPTACWLATYILFEKYLKQNNKVLWFLPILCIIHGSMFFWITLFIFAHYTRKSLRIWTYLFILSIFLSTGFEIMADPIRNLLPSFFDRYFDAYYGEDAMLEEAEKVMSRKSGSFIQLFQILGRLFSNVLVLCILYVARKENVKDHFTSLFQVFLVLITIANFLGFIPFARLRFTVLLYPIMAVLWIHYIQHQRKIYNIICFIPIVFAYDVVMQSYLLYQLTDPHFWICSPIYTVFHMLSGGCLYP